MNIKPLAKLYDRLTPHERLPLIIAAADRGDDAEADRLARSAPRFGCRLPDYHGLGEGLLLLHLLYMIAQLERASIYWHGTGLAEELSEFPIGKDDRARAERWRKLLRLMAYHMTVEADAWKQLCAELHIDPEALLRDFPAYDTIRRWEEAARLDAYPPEEAAAALRSLGIEADKAPTVEATMKAMREFLDSRVKWWG
jgi:hypothetical protein